MAKDDADIKILTALAEATGRRSHLLEQAHARGVDLIDQTLQEISAEVRNPPLTDAATIAGRPPSKL